MLFPQGNSEDDPSSKLAQQIKGSELKILSDEFLDIMKMSLHPPHVFEKTKNDEDGEQEKIIPNSAFPFCFYGSEKKSKDIQSPYQDFYGSEKKSKDIQSPYCKDFQTTFNEQGQCYSFNNVNLNVKTPENFVNIRKVTGCGRKSGLQLVIVVQFHEICL